MQAGTTGNSSNQTCRLIQIRRHLRKEAKKKRKIKKRTFNIGNKKKGTTSIHSNYYYDGGVPSDDLIKYIEESNKNEVENEFDGKLTSPIAQEIDLNLYSNEPNDKYNKENGDHGNIKWDSTVEIPKLQDTIPAEEEDEFVEYNISTVEIPDYLIGKPKMAQDIFSVPVINDEDDTIKASSTKINRDSDDKIEFYDNPRAQMDNGAKSLVTNLLHLLRNVKFYNERHPCRVRMKGATSKVIIVPTAVGYFRVKTNNIDGYIDVKCYYSPHFTSTIGK